MSPATSSEAHLALVVVDVRLLRLAHHQRRERLPHVHLAQPVGAGELYAPARVHVRLILRGSHVTASHEGTSTVVRLEVCATRRIRRDPSATFLARPARPRAKYLFGWIFGIFYLLLFQGRSVIQRENSSVLFLSNFDGFLSTHWLFGHR